MKGISIYIHIPFCIKKCDYCSFNSYEIKKFSNDIINKYFETIKKEIFYKKEFFIRKKINSIYFGGGTPSVVPVKYIENLLKLFNFDNSSEITIEINPGTVNFSQLQYLKKIGINRVSIGIQTFNDVLLKYLGRIYSVKEAINCIGLVKKIFENFSIDLIFGIPKQTIKDLKTDLSYVKKIDPKHISWYCLTIEDGCKFYEQKIKEIDEEIFPKMFKLIISCLKNFGFNHYEISNFAKENYKSVHNLNYWNHQEYLGFGAGAVSFLGKKRLKNKETVENYIKNFDKPNIEKLSERDILNEYIFLNLRKIEGLSIDDLKKKFNINIPEKFFKKIKFFEKKGFLKLKNNKISLSEKGIPVSNEIFSQLLC